MLHYRFRTPHLEHHTLQRRPVDKVDSTLSRELPRIFCVRTRGYKESSIDSSDANHAEELANRLHINLPFPPLLALNVERLALSTEHQIDAAVCSSTAVLYNEIPAPTKRFANDRLELFPGEVADILDALLLIELPSQEERAQCTASRPH